MQWRSRDGAPRCEHPRTRRAHPVPGRLTSRATTSKSDRPLGCALRTRALLATTPSHLSARTAERVARLDLPFNRYGIDPYGVDQAELGRFFTALQWLSTKYFHVDPYGLEHVPPSGPAMLVGNHSGGVAIDGAMILATCFFRLDPPRLAQGMADKFISKIPGASQVSARVGQFTGLPEHAERLLRDDRLLMVFPEGARGTAKLAHEAD